MSVEKSRNNLNMPEAYLLKDNIDKINKIESMYKIYKFRTKAKHLIEKHKKCYSIISTLKEKNLKLLVYYPEHVKEYQVIYEKILDQNIVYIPKDDCQKMFLLKFNFINAKNENIIDPKYNNEFSDNMFLNVINLRKILEKEEERKEDFNTFLETYFTSKILSKEILQYFFHSSQNMRKTHKKRTLTIKGSIKLTKIGEEIKSENNLLSILKKRNSKRIPSGKKISFGNVTKLVYYVS